MKGFAIYCGEIVLIVKTSLILPPHRHFLNSIEKITFPLDFLKYWIWIAIDWMLDFYSISLRSSATELKKLDQFKVWGFSMINKKVLQI